ncbi:MAG: transposase [Bryobacteraceae bacterium]|nr:transposase [Bryobacteraceae bacterium]
MTSGQAFVAMDRLLDAGGFGPLHLQRPEIAAVVRDAMFHCALVDYDLHSWVIMPNHVHMLLTPHTDVSSFLRRLKGFSARQANQILKQAREAFWQDESYDHLVRSDQEFRNIERYILSNPVSAGLVELPELYPWSSATSVT